MTSTLPMLVSKNSTTSLHCPSMFNISTTADLIFGPSGFLKQLQSDFSIVFHHLFPRILESTRQFVTKINLNVVFYCHIIIWQNWHLWRLSSFWKYNETRDASLLQISHRLIDILLFWGNGFLAYEICVSLLVYTNLLKFNLMANISWIWFRVTQFCRIWCNTVGSSREYLLKNNKYIRFAETFNRWYINTSARFFDQQYHTIICCGFSESCSWNFCGIIFSTLLVKYCRQLLRDSIQVNRISF